MKKVVLYTPMVCVLISIILLVSIVVIDISIMLVPVAGILLIIPLTIRVFQNLATDIVLKTLIKTVFVLSISILSLFFIDKGMAVLFAVLLYLPVAIIVIYTFVAEMCCIISYHKDGHIDPF